MCLFTQGKTACIDIFENIKLQLWIKGIHGQLKVVIS
jgi:hypothetical protein